MDKQDGQDKTKKRDKTNISNYETREINEKCLADPVNPFKS